MGDAKALVARPDYRIDFIVTDKAEKFIAEQTPNSFYPDQYNHPENPAAHYRTTGPEIWEDTEGSITHFVASIGTGGTISCGTTSNAITASSDPFTNSTTDDYHIIATIGTSFPRDKGTNLGAPYNVDRDGCTRGSDGTWDVGAYEYASGSCS